jgi:probable F420-dependent oxidoreductase
VRLGYFGINMGPLTEPGDIAAVARAAEAAGFASVWAGEHVVLPDPHVPPSPMDPRDRALDPLLALTWAAAATERLRVATGVLILPQRNPVVLAKEAATLDVLSGCRLLLGIGVGYLEPEFRAVGANFEQRGAVTDEYLGALRALWYDERPAFGGDHVAFAGVDAHPRPRQARIPIIVGGGAPPALRRAVRQGDGWYGFGLTPARARRALARLRATQDAIGRPAELGELEITITPAGQLTAESAAEFAALGVDRLLPWDIDWSQFPGREVPPGDLDTVLAGIEANAAAVAGLG